MATYSASGFSYDTDDVASTEFVERDEIELDEHAAHVITMLHGIRDSGIWALDLNYHSRRNGLKVKIEPISYGWLGAFPFLLRIGSRRIERQVCGEINSIHGQYPEAIHSLVAHSNGTKLVSKIIPGLNFKYRNVFFCGSVCKRNEAPVAPIYADTMVNDCSPRDIWPLVAQIINPWQYEASGTYGFRRAGIEDRFFSVAHGGCLTPAHFEKMILPVILRRALPLGERPRSLIPFGTASYVRIVFLLVLVSIGFWEFR